MSSIDEMALKILENAPGKDEASERALLDRAANVLRPAGALARLDAVAAWLASWQHTTTPQVTKPAVVVFVADHGVTTEGVSAYPAEVTVAMLRALNEGVATAAAMSRSIGARLLVVDVGVGNPTGNIATEPALSEERFTQCFDAGREAVATLDTDLVIFGEMGIGNTTPAAAVAATLFGGPAEEWTGRGTGVDDETWARKVQAVERARARISSDASPLEILRQVGGAELAAIAGAMVEARVRSIPVLLDGFVVTAAVAPLAVLDPGALDNCLAGHRSPEPGHAMLLDKLGLEPLLDLNMRLGEASGALAALPLVRLAATVVVDVATFEEWGLTR
ncbi:MAG TPA: nicotinate-nucleotide--dimethylbenzimidazole phosphoribosyltransferase [Actinomycetota bacterium]|nr:nicotinate-nucleotide--dimethylbenzimidazole phosphoribosyltransferase [Actinomycetota bacterium]